MVYKMYWGTLVNDFFAGFCLQDLTLMEKANPHRAVTVEHCHKPTEPIFCLDYRGYSHSINSDITSTLMTK